MRLSQVIGIIAVGASLGAAAVLLPLQAHQPGSAGAMMAGLAGQAQFFAATITGRIAPDPSKTPGTPDAATLQANTIDHLMTGTVGAAGASATSRPMQRAQVTQAPWTAQVTIANDRASSRAPSSRGLSEAQSYQLARDLQSELKRVGCYWDDIDGDWGATSKQAMAAFNERVNASLPFDRPDHILLALVQGHVGRACGAGCPQGQNLGSEGRCAPAAVVAQNRQRSTLGAGASVGLDRNRDSESNAAIGATGIATAVAGAGQRFVPAPTPAIRPAGKPAAVASQEKPFNDRAHETAYATDTTTATTAPARAAPLPGRMAIGGPIAPPLASDPTPARRPTEAVAPISVAKAPAEDTKSDAAYTAETRRPITTERDEPSITRRAQSGAPVRPRRAAVVRPPQATYVAPRRTKASRQRQLVYQLFQDPTRN